MSLTLTNTVNNNRFLNGNEREKKKNEAQREKYEIEFLSLYPHRLLYNFAFFTYFRYMSI